jgi:hypothetical protein
MTGNVVFVGFALAGASGFSLSALAGFLLQSLGLSESGSVRAMGSPTPEQAVIDELSRPTS